jgi:predicted nucleic acid-binding protein
VTVLVDTTVLIDHLRGDPRALRLLEAMFEQEERVWAAVPTRTEVIAGIRPNEHERMTELFGILSWVDIDVAVADMAGELAHRYARSHGGIDTTDYLIAAAAQSIDARLITLNVRHYPMFEGLVPPYPTSPRAGRGQRRSESTALRTRTPLRTCSRTSERGP